MTDLYIRCILQNVIRTQLYIPETVHERVKVMARSKKQSLAKLYREFIASGLKKETSKNRGGDLTVLARLNIKGGPKNLSGNIDKYIYGGK